MKYELALCARGNLTRDEVYDKLVVRGDYIMETKYDGYRATLAKYGERRTELRSRNGMLLSNPRLENAMNRVPISDLSASLVLDGEIIFPGRSYNELAKAIGGGYGKDMLVFAAFDILASPTGSDLPSLTYLTRSHVLTEYTDRYFDSSAIQCVDTYEGDHAIDYYDNSKAHNLDEGFVLKKQDAPYVVGRSNNWLRSKFTDTISVMPIDVTDSGQVECCVWTGNGCQQLHVATVQVPADDLILILNKNLNMVLEIEAFGLDDSNMKLRHPVYKGCRFDTDSLSCTIDQFESLRSF